MSGVDVVVVDVVMVVFVVLVIVLGFGFVLVSGNGAVNNHHVDKLSTLFEGCMLQVKWDIW